MTDLIDRYIYLTQRAERMATCRCQVDPNCSTCGFVGFHCDDCDHCDNHDEKNCVSCERNASERPDWLKCIRQPNSDFSYCGQYIKTEWHFVDVEHARGAEEQGSRLVPCQNCLNLAELNIDE